MLLQCLSLFLLETFFFLPQELGTSSHCLQHGLLGSPIEAQNTASQEKTPPDLWKVHTDL